MVVGVGQHFSNGRLTACRMGVRNRSRLTAEAIVGRLGLITAKLVVAFFLNNSTQLVVVVNLSNKNGKRLINVD